MSSPPLPFPLHPTLIAAALALGCHTASAQASPAPDAAPAAAPGAQGAPLPEVKVKAAAAPGVTPGTITSTTKGQTRPLESPQSISVVTREMLDQTQVKTLVEALSTVAGVVAGERGRRGFDDVGIRGQVFGQEKYVDGLNTVRSGYVPAEEIFGAERIEVLKGPASLLFGTVRPGGMVNVVSKRPQPEAFGAIGLSVGNQGFKELTADVGRPLADDGRSAWRVAALANDSDDATDRVFFKNKYVAPSARFALGARTDLTLLASFQDRQWLRNQGLAPKGTVLPNKNGAIRRSLFVGDPSFGHNDAERSRLGYALQHRFDGGWTLQQNFRWDDYTMNQRVTSFYGPLAADERTQSRTGSIQHDDYRAFALDTYVNGNVASAFGTHELTIGLDLGDKGGRLSSRTCTAADLGTIDLFQPTYGRLGPATPCSGALSDNTQDILSAGLYLRDHLRIGRQWHLTAGARHDRVTVTSTNHAAARPASTTKDAATTGMAGLVYEALPGIAPYASVATSFVPVTGTAFGGVPFEPETGRQLEAGVKFERDGGRQVASVALYDLKRRNVTTADPAHSGFSVQQGEHHSRGLEVEAAAELRNGWNLNAAYAYTDAVVSRSNTPAEVGRSVTNVPRHSLSAWGLYRIDGGALAGFGFGLGLRKVSERTGSSYDFTIPGYTVLDAAIRYQGRGWRAAMNVRNLADKTYYGGALSNSVVTLGDTRQVRLNVVYEM